VGVKPVGQNPVGVKDGVTAHELYRFYHAGDSETAALRGVSLRVEPREVVAVTGPSGSGKSTLLSCLAGLEDPDGGTVYVNGQRLSRQPEGIRAGVRGSAVGVLLQAGNLLGHLTVLDNVRLAQRYGHGGPNPRQLLEQVGLAERAGSWPARLSGGEAARAGLAVAVANSPSVLLADEPTGEVDPDNERAVLALLRDRAGAGTAVLVVTHSRRVSDAADRVLRLVDGRLTDDD
jgi:putative ABC transport system ATP-binding protein